MDRDSKKFIFTYNADNLKIEDKTPIKEIFQNNPFPKVMVTILK